jgi:hypothetical protein
MKAHTESRGIFLLFFLILALDQGEWVTPLYYFTPVKDTQYPLYKRLGEPEVRYVNSCPHQDSIPCLSSLQGAAILAGA